MVTQNNSIDKVIWRCHKRAPPHDIKTNIWEGYIFERFQIKIYILYFIIYFCLIDNMSISVEKSKCDSLCSQLVECSISSKSIYIFFSVLRQRLKIKMHK